MPRIDVRSQSFRPVPVSTPQARRFVVAVARDWGFDTLLDDAALCAAELATNALLHTRDEFIVTIRPIANGIRIGVLDSCPDQLPVVIPQTGLAADLAATGTTGRGIYIVGSTAQRWGISTTTRTKKVWAELVEHHRFGGFRDPFLELAHRQRADEDTVSLRFEGLPVLALLASGAHLDETVRDLQLYRRDNMLTDPDHLHIFDLLDRSALPRLAGRHEALRAAAAGHVRYDLELVTTTDALKATAALSEILDGLSARIDPQGVPLEEEVVALRAWLAGETRRQLTGHRPLPCPLDA